MVKEHTAVSDLVLGVAVLRIGARRSCFLFGFADDAPVTPNSHPVLAK